MRNKTELRVYAKNKRQSFDTKTLSRMAFDNLMDIRSYKEAKNVLCYFPKKYEVNLNALFAYEAKNYYLPKTVGNELTICRYERGDSLIRSSFGVYEPSFDREVALSEIDLIIVPALMVDKKGYRLGYGKGFYDRLLARTSAVSIVVVFDELLVEDLPKDDFDRSCNIVVTEKRVLFI